jgi:hypothetical protein
MYDCFMLLAIAEHGVCEDAKQKVENELRVPDHISEESAGTLGLDRWNILGGECCHVV